MLKKLAGGVNRRRPRLVRQSEVFAVLFVLLILLIFVLLVVLLVLLIILLIILILLVVLSVVFHCGFPFLKVLFVKNAVQRQIS